MTDSLATRNPYRSETIGCCSTLGLVKSSYCLFRTAALLSVITAVAFAILIALGLAGALQATTAMFCTEAAFIGVGLLVSFVAYKLGRAIQPTYDRELSNHKDIEERSADYNEKAKAYFDASAAYRKVQTQETAEALVRAGKAYIAVEKQADSVRITEGVAESDTSLLEDGLKSIANQYHIEFE